MNTSRLIKPTVLALALGLTLGLGGCKKDEAQAPTETKAATQPAKLTNSPDDAVKAFSKALANDDLMGAVALSLTTEQLDKIKAEYEANKTKEPINDEERKQFAEFVAKINASDAEAQLMSQLEPMLQKYDTEYAMQLPMMLGMAQGLASQGIADNEDLTPDQKKQATESVTALIGWAQGVNFGDRELAKRAVHEVVKTGQALELTTLDDLRNLPFDGMMQKAGTAFGGVKRVFNVYGFDMNGMLNSLETKVIETNGDTAKVQTTYTMFDKQMVSTSNMVKRGDRWYDANMAELVQDSLDKGDSDAE